MSHKPSHVGRNTACAFALLFVLHASAMLAQQADPKAPAAVQVAEESTIIPTYTVGPADRNPMFYTHESYQGAEKRIYPYALQDDLIHTRQDKTYTSLRLENEYVAISVLPELGGRIFNATDKTNQYDFFYRQHVIKPALIGMLGAWISGGVEWCAFHHHRNTTFMPVDYTLTENRDGSRTIWIGETERRHRMRWLIGLTLYPGKSYLEATVKFFNRTPQPHSILYWANVAVHVNEQYQVIFPPSVQVATYHSKIDFTHWPLSQGKYRGHDYTGVDIRWWKNSPPSNSFFVWNLQEDFMGGYDHSRQAGVVHVANHNIVGGAKLWEWGTGPYGRAWDEILTDKDGPYAELMVGAFSDNQPDYSWIKPYEVKTFKQYWYPVREIGGFKNANLHGAVNLELKTKELALVGFHTTSQHANAKAMLRAGQKVLFEERTQFGPDRPFRREVSLPAGVRATDLRVSLETAEGKELIAYQPVERKPVERLPETVKTPANPKDIQTIEELYLTGLRVEQIHNPSVDPAEYYQEALRRDPGDSRCNTMLGVHANKRGSYEQAEKYLRDTIRRISADYTRPANAEAYFQLGLALRGQGRETEAYDSFYRATWDSAFHSAAYYQLAELSCRKGEFKEALERVSQSLRTNTLNTKALNLQAGILRKLGLAAQAKDVASAVLEIDPLDFWAMNEMRLALLRSGNQVAAEATRSRLAEKMRGEAQAYLELAADYLGPGMWDEAIEILRHRDVNKLPGGGTYPLVDYLLGYVTAQRGEAGGARLWYASAANAPADYCFPFRMEERDALRAAIKANPSDAKAHYYLGNLLFDLQPDQAIEAWEKSRSLDDSLGTLHRNLGWAYYRHKNDIAKALASYEKAIACRDPDPRLFLELDTLYEFGNLPVQRRLAALEQNHRIVAQRPDSLLREITVLVLAGKYEKAIDYLDNQRFHAKEGSEGVHDVYADAHLLSGLAFLKQKRFAEALSHFARASEYPENLSVGRPQNDPRAPQVAFHCATAYEAQGNAAKSRELYRQGADQQGTSDWPETRFYQAQCLLKLGEREQADRIFDALVESGKQRLKEEAATDFFAKFGEQETAKARTASAHFVIGLGYLGKGPLAEARSEIAQAAKMNLSHVWAKYWLAEIQ
mgnify:CR=1 FL=1